MCGIVGHYLRRPFGPDQHAAYGGEDRVLLDCASTIAHRGPDGAGVWIRANVGLAHRRLSIIDTSDAGTQPMHSRSGRWTVTFNGELFNFRELRSELVSQGVGPFRSGSDTEVLLEAVERFGVVGAVRRFVGMFAFALWDDRDRVLYLVRDRLGIKPLAYTQSHHGIVFASELTALERHPLVDTALDVDAVHGFVRLGYFEAPCTPFANVTKVLPGHILEFRSPTDRPTDIQYWSALGVALAGQQSPFAGDAAERESETERLLSLSIRQRMIADVPIGAFLSGGIDSSLVVSLMQKESSTAVRTFSIANESRDYDEGASARAVADHLGARHESFVVTNRDVTSVVRDVVEKLDEPIGDSSLVPTYLVSKLARSSVTVALSGDGGDEVFGGYNRHVYAPFLSALALRSPTWLRSGVARGADALRSPRMLRAISNAGATRLVRLPEVKLDKIARVLRAGSVDAVYELLRSSDPAWASVAHAPMKRAQRASSLRTDLLTPASALMLADTLDYLPNDILAKVDRASMAVSLEARVPLLDHRLFEFAWTLPERDKVRTARRGKLPLRSILSKHVPRALTDRPKMGFGIPIGEFLRGDLRDWGASMLDGAKAAPFFSSTAIDRLWAEHQLGRNHDQLLWNLIVMASWLRRRKS